MTPDHFVTVFDAGTSGFKDWDFSAFGLIFVAIGAALFVAPRLIKASGIPFLNFQSRMQNVFRYVFLGFALFWTVASFSATYLPYARHQAMLRENRCSVVEGAVEDFVPMPYEGHGDESFEVAGVDFSYSDYAVSDGFNTTASHGGPIKGGEYVRICYDPSSHEILRLAIRDFKGKIPDYSAALSFPPPSKPLSSVSPDQGPPPYASLFIVLYFLDFLGILTLYAPYLRTFFRLETVSCGSPVNMTALHNGSTVKLPNSLVRWDEAHNAIWLRPRGLNMLQIPLMVAKLNLGPTGATVTGYELRFSSGFPVIMIAFFGGAYLMFSQVGFPDETPVVFLGIFAVIAAVSFWFRTRRTKQRFRALLEDELAHLKDIS